MKKIITLLLIVAGLVFIAPPAQASYLRCNSVIIPRTGGSDASATICVTYVNQLDGTGYRVTDLTLDCRPESVFENDMQLNGHSLRIFDNRNGNIVWSRSDAGSNVTNNCWRKYNIDAEEGNVRLPEAGGTAFYDFTARLDFQPDKRLQVGKTFP